MFQRFTGKKKNPKALYAVADGECIAMENVSDPVFANKTLGDGIAVIPRGNVIVAPCDGEITLVTPTLHALGLISEDGKELMLHVGIDTVELNGQGFTILTEQGKKVVKGQPLLEFDSEFMRKHAVDMTTMLIVLDSEKDAIDHKNIGQTVRKGMDVVIQYH